MPADLSAVVIVVILVPPVLQVAVGGRFERLVGPVHGSAATAVSVCVIQLCVYRLEEVVALEIYPSLSLCSQIMLPLIMTKLRRVHTHTHMHTHTRTHTNDLILQDCKNIMLLIDASIEKDARIK